METFAVQTGGGKLVDQAHGAFEGHGVHGDQSVLIAFSLIIRPQLGAGVHVDNAVAFLNCRCFDISHRTTPTD